MGRFLVLLTAALLIAYLVDRGFRRLRGKLDELLGVGTQADRGKKRGRHARQLVPCSICGIHVLRTRALAEEPDGHRGVEGSRQAVRFYCEACRQSAAGSRRSA